jgi:hypothetical protein
MLKSAGRNYSAGFLLPVWQDFLPGNKIKLNFMNQDKTTNKEKVPSNEKAKAEVPKTPQEKKQQQTDPQITELKGFIDPKEDLEVKGTDNPF